MNRKYSKLVGLIIYHVRNVSEYNDMLNRAVPSRHTTSFSWFLSLKCPFYAWKPGTCWRLAKVATKRLVNHEKCFLCFPSQEIHSCFSGHNIVTLVDILPGIITSGLLCNLLTQISHNIILGRCWGWLAHIICTFLNSKIWLHVDGEWWRCTTRPLHNLVERCWQRLFEKCMTTFF